MQGDMACIVFIEQIAREIQGQCKCIFTFYILVNILYIFSLKTKWIHTNTLLLYHACRPQSPSSHMHMYLMGHNWYAIIFFKEWNFCTKHNSTECAWIPRVCTHSANEFFTSHVCRMYAHAGRKAALKQMRLLMLSTTVAHKSCRSVSTEVISYGLRSSQNAYLIRLSVFLVLLNSTHKVPFEE